MEGINQYMYSSHRELNLTILEDASVFIYQISRTGDGRIVLHPCSKLTKSIEDRWRDIVATNPPSIDDSTASKLLIQSLFLLLIQESRVTIIEQHWLSFFYYIALQVANKIRHHVSYQDITTVLTIQQACLASIGNIYSFFNGFNRDYNEYKNLLSGLKGYAYNTIKYRAYPYLRVDFNDPNLGRSNLSLPFRYSKVVTERAIEECNKISKEEIKYLLSLPDLTKDYLRQVGKNIDRLDEKDWRYLADVYASTTGQLVTDVKQKLETVGAAIRKSMATHYNWTRSLDEQLNDTETNNQNTLLDTIESEVISPEDGEENQQAIEVCDRYLNANTNPHQRAILYLRFYWDLQQTEIAQIFNIDQSNISRQIRSICVKLVQNLMEEINPHSQIEIDRAVILKLVTEMLSTHIHCWTIFPPHSQSSQTLGRLIQEYQQSDESPKRSALITEIRTILDRLWH
jgi:RNA polymerase sigma factor (sigma-70 family)